MHLPLIIDGNINGSTIPALLNVPIQLFSPYLYLKVGTLTLLCSLLTPSIPPAISISLTFLPHPNQSQNSSLTLSPRPSISILLSVILSFHWYASRPMTTMPKLIFWWMLQIGSGMSQITPVRYAMKVRKAMDMYWNFLGLGHQQMTNALSLGLSLECQIERLGRNVGFFREKRRWERRRRRLEGRGIRIRLSIVMIMFMILYIYQTLLNLSHLTTNLSHKSPHNLPFSKQKIDNIQIQMGATCQNCQRPQHFDYKQSLQIAKIEQLPNPDFYNDVTRPIALQLGPFKYSDNDPSTTSIPLQGPITLEGGARYLGQFSNGLKKGRGKQVWEDYSLYEGYWDNDKANGRGRLIHADGDVYQGEWLNDKAHGKGVYLHKDGASYTGEWFEDIQHGFGIQKWTYGSSYQGNYQRGMKHGHGKFTWPDGSTYSGDFLQNLIEGKGRYEWSDGRTYQGDWKGNKMSGKGEFIWPDHRRYVGEYVDDKKQGYGIVYWADGRQYEGMWRDGKQHGRGRYRNANGVWREGEWVNGKKMKWV